MSPGICLLSVVSRLNLVVLLFSAISLPSCLSDRVAEFALTTKEENNLKEQNQEEAATVEEEELDLEDLEAFQPTHQWQTVRPGRQVEIFLVCK
uniref:Uncharacterized protein n=1 Tax=Sphaerodactylus townsendi TaxID=933632 RepID=A0ACB8GEB6_9SAUR